VRPDIQPGAQFPDYELPDHEGNPRALSELQGSIPMVLHLSRGGYCPKEQRFLRRLVDVYPDFRVAHTRIVTISTDNQLDTNEFRDTLGAEWPFLSDSERIVQQDLDIQEFTDPVHDPMIPHTFVLEPGLRIFSVYVGYWFWGRPTLHELHMDLRSVMEKTRRDFDPTAPGLRDAWERRDRAAFLVEPSDGAPIRYTEGGSVGVKR
jgi:peroxiredoxin